MDSVKNLSHYHLTLQFFKTHLSLLSDIMLITSLKADLHTALATRNATEYNCI